MRHADLADFADAAHMRPATGLHIHQPRVVANALWLKRPQDVRPLLLGAFVYALLAVAIGMAIVLALFPLPQRIAVVLAACSMRPGNCIGPTVLYSL